VLPGGKLINSEACQGEGRLVVSTRNFVQDGPCCSEFSITVVSQTRTRTWVVRVICMLGQGRKNQAQTQDWRDAL
jgi:hypothetical protein